MMSVKDDNGLKELVDLRNRNTFVKYFKMVLLMYLCQSGIFVSVS